MRTFMTRFLRALVCALAVGSASPALAAGSLPISLSQNVDVNGRPLAGALLYVYQVGTVATPQNIFSDPGLTLTLPNPLQADQTGRLPAFYLADGSVHVRLTDSGGVVVYDYPSMLVIGPSSGGGGGGGSVDPTAIMATGDIKFRPTTEVLTGWVRINGQNIGSATSGATGRANADTQSLYVYLWGVCDNTHCPVSTGRGVSGLADFNANKTITLPDWRGRIPVGLDDMGNTAAGRLLSSNVTSGGGDGVTTPLATGGEANHTLATAEMPVTTPAGTLSTNGAHTHFLVNTDQPVVGNTQNDLSTSNFLRKWNGNGSGQTAEALLGGSATTPTIALSSTNGDHTHTFTGTPFGSGTAHNNMQPFMLGTWHIKL